MLPGPLLPGPLLPGVAHGITAGGSSAVGWGAPPRVIIDYPVGARAAAFTTAGIRAATITQADRDKA